MGHRFSIVTNIKQSKDIYYKNKQCICLFDGCGSGKRNNCTSVFGSII